LVGIFEEGVAAGESSRNAAAGSEAMIRALLVCASLCLAAGIDAARAGPEPGAEGSEADIPLTATAPATPKTWSSMSPQQQQLLHGYQDKWDALPPERQQALAKGSQRWLSMTPEQRSGAQQRFAQWRAMPPEQRQQLRQRFQQFKSMPPEQQQRVRESFNRFRQMPPEKRQELRRQWHQLSPEQRRKFIQRTAPPRHNAR
jgi:Protein of unknown function (DUF3106)